MVLTIAALMAAMMVSAGPAKADVSFGGSSVDVDVDVGDGFGFDVGDGSGFNVGDGIRFVDVGDDDDDDDDADGINNSFFFSQVNSEVDDIEPGGFEFS